MGDPAGVKSEQEMVREEILAEINRLLPTEKATTMEIAIRMRELVWTNGNYGLLALALVGAETAMTETNIDGVQHG